MLWTGNLIRKCNVLLRELQTTEKCVVELVEHPETHKRYVKKRIMGRYQDLAFQKELAVARILGSHPNIIELHDCAILKDERDKPFEYQLLYEYCEGGDLYQLASQNRKKRIRKTQVWKIMMGILNGVKALHDHCIIHRDLKLENVVLTGDNIPKICDFSFCEWDSYSTELCDKQIVKENPSLRKIDDYLVGTCGYISHDLILTKIATPRTDVFSLGVLFYELFTCYTAFEAKCPVDYVVNPNELEYPRRCTKNIVVLMKNMMSKHPHQRPKLSELVDFFSGN